MSGLNELTIAAARDALRKGSLSTTLPNGWMSRAYLRRTDRGLSQRTDGHALEACLAAIEAAGVLNAFVHKTPEIARERAAAADQRLKAGDAPAMCGIPVGIKDLFCTKGVPSQAASNILRNFKPEYESTVSQQLADAGAVMLGKLNMDEFAMGSSNETSCYGNAVNPWRRGNDDAALTPGGSSGGSAQRRCGRPLPCRHRHRYRRLHPPARRLHRHHRDQTDLWPLLALGHRRLRLVARPGRADDQGCA